MAALDIGSKTVLMLVVVAAEAGDEERVGISEVLKQIVFVL